ncbi:MAG: protein-glutamate O-methyltransferase CheR [Sphingomonas sp.]
MRAEAMPSEESPLTKDDLEMLSETLRRRSGVTLPPHNAVALTNLLSPVLRRFGLTDIAALTAMLQQGDDGLAQAVAEALATSATGFFRDPSAFDRFAAQTLPRLLADRAGARHLRIWCAACAAGQEPWSIAMQVAEAGLEGWTVEILATDFNTTLVERAEVGLYSEAEMRGVSEGRRTAHFVPDGDSWRIRDGLRGMMVFRSFNLLDPCGGLGRFDAIFCRNLLIYFDTETAAALLGRLTNVLIPGGALMLGLGEGLRGFSGNLQSVAPGEYVRPAATDAGG